MRKREERNPRMCVSMPMGTHYRTRSCEGDALHAEYVSADDYLALQAELDEARALLRRWLGFGSDMGLADKCRAFLARMEKLRDGKEEKHG